MIYKYNNEGWIFYDWYAQVNGYEFCCRSILIHECYPRTHYCSRRQYVWWNDACEYAF